jgi:superfamily II DNA/RNA helicase
MSETDSTYDMILSDGVKPYKSFEDMELSDELAMGIISYGFERPSKIQQVAIVPMKNGVDIMAQSQSGTGKTGAFVIGGLSRVDPKLQQPQVLVINPTHELAKQTHKVATEIGQHMKIKALFITGGSGARKGARGGAGGGGGGCARHLCFVRE